MKLTKEFKVEAKAKLKGNWEKGIVVTVVYLLIMMATSALFLGVGALLVEGPLSLGYIIYMLKFTRGQKFVYDDEFSGFKKFVSPMLTYLLRKLIVFAWSLLLIVPGIIKALEYSMTMYILADNPTMTAKECMAKSKEIMNGNKVRLFKLVLSFIGWWLLSFITCGILYWVYVMPYYQTAFILFYDEIKNGTTETTATVEGTPDKTATQKPAKAKVEKKETVEKPQTTETK